MVALTLRKMGGYFEQLLLYRTWADNKDQHGSNDYLNKMQGVEVTIMALSRALYGLQWS